jgi:soluble lytic murein transglycosylase-like protein
LSGFTVIPLTVIFVSSLLASLAMKITPPMPQPVPIATLPSTLAPANITTDSSSQITAEIIADSPSNISAKFSSELSASFTPEIQFWGENIVRWSSAFGLDPNLAATAMQIESCGDPRATSRSGAMGLFQVMPFHFHTTDEPYNPETNAARGLAYLKKSLETANGDARLALAGYNGGIGVISRSEWTWPAETKRYVQFGWPIYIATQSIFASNEAVQDWYVKYGASLCRQASARLGLSE